MTELEKLPENLKEQIEDLLRKRQVIRINVWLEKMGNKEQLKEVLGMERINWHKKHEEIILQKEITDENKVMKGTGSEIYKIFTGNRRSQEDLVINMIGV